MRTADQPLSLEDDISSNEADFAPFENAGPPCKLAKENFARFNVGRVPAEVKEIDLLKLAKRATLPIPSAQDREG